MDRSKNKKTSLDARTKWSYCIGSVGRDAAYALVSMYILTYIQYTVKLTVTQYAAISFCVVLCLIWDAINDPLMGIIIENSKLKHGKFRPWIISGAVLNSIVIVLLFSVRPTGWGFVVFFAISYLLWGMTFTMNDISYWGLLPSLTSDSNERGLLLTIMSIFISIGQFSVAGIVPMVVAGNAVFTYRCTALVVALAFILFQTITFLGVKERPRVDLAEKLSLKKMFRILARNDQLVVIGIGSLLFNIGNGLLILFGVNFFYFTFGYDEGGKLIFLFTVMYGLGNLLSQSCFHMITQRISREKLLKIIITVLMIGYALFLGYGYILPKNIILLNLIGFIIFFCQGLYNLTVVVMLNNTIEYDEYRFAERHDSVISAVRSFSVKLAGAINQGVCAIVLIISGIYHVSQDISKLEIEAGKGAMTSNEVLLQASEFISHVKPYQTLILRIGMVAVPVIAMIACYVLIRKKYIIDEAEYERIVHEIELRDENPSKVEGF